MLVSSAKIIVLKLYLLSLVSHLYSVYRIKSRGPKTEPCGTPCNFLSCLFVNCIICLQSYPEAILFST